MNSKRVESAIEQQHLQEGQESVPNGKQEVNTAEKLTVGANKLFVLRVLFVVFAVLLVIPFLLGLVFLVFPNVALLQTVAITQIFWYAILSALLFILAQLLLVEPNENHRRAFLGVFITHLILFLAVYVIGIFASFTFGFVVSITFLALQFIDHVLILTLLGLLLYSLPVRWTQTISLYTLAATLLAFSVVLTAIVFEFFTPVVGASTLISLYTSILVSFAQLIATFIRYLPPILKQKLL